MRNTSLSIKHFSTKDLRNFIKYVYSKYLYEVDNLIVTDLQVFTYSLDALIEYGKKDLRFLQRWESFLTNARRILPELNRPSRYNPFRTKNILHISYTAEKFGNELTFSPRAYFGLQSNEKFMDRYENAMITRHELRHYSPAAYIGVGYRDKGACRFKHQDGSPSWQEVASSTQRLTSEDYLRERNELLVQPLVQRITATHSQTPEEMEALKLRIIELEFDVRLQSNEQDPKYKLMFHDPNQEWLAKYCRQKPEGEVDVTHTLQTK